MIEEDKDSLTMVVMEEQNYFGFQLFKPGLSWKIERVIWIGFYKNDKNNECKIDLLPKDIVKVILDMLPNQSMGKEFVKGKYIYL